MVRRKLTEEEKKIRAEEKRERERNRYRRLKENSEGLAQRREKYKERQKTYRKKENMCRLEKLYGSLIGTKNENPMLNDFQKKPVASSNSTNRGIFMLEGCDNFSKLPMIDCFTLDINEDFEKNDKFRENDRSLDG